jgi:cyclic pyranopterin phosphate synthase
VAKLYRLPGAKGNIGLISPVSAHFCGECNRLRLTADGKLKPCLHAADEYSIKGLDFDGVKAVFEKAGIVMWECRNCGHLVTGTKAPEVCPVCNHPQAFFEVRKENY